MGVTSAFSNGKPKIEGPGGKLKDRKIIFEPYLEQSEPYLEQSKFRCIRLSSEVIKLLNIRR